MPREGGETERNQTSGLKNRLLTAGQYVGAGTLAAFIVASYVKLQNEADQGLLFKPDEQKNEQFTTGQLQADAQLASVDFQRESEKKTYKDRLNRASKEMSGLVGPLEALRIAEYEPLITKAAEDANIPKDMLLGLVIAESIADPLAVSHSGAKGLTQMMDPIANKYELNIAGDLTDDRFIPEKVLPKSAQEIREYYDRFGEWSLAFWAWHAGTPQVYEAVRMYAHLENYDVKLEDTNVKPVNDTDEAFEEATRIAIERMDKHKKFIVKNNMTVVRLFENETVRNAYSGASFDRTWDYVPRIEESVKVYRLQDLAQQD